MSDKNWEEIGTVIGSTSTDSYGFLLSSLKASVGDIVITEAEIPSPERGSKRVFIWGRIVSMDRTNPTFPNEAAAELNRIGAIEETIAMVGSEHLHAEVQIIGCTNTSDKDKDNITLNPLSYPVKPTSKVLYPDGDIINKLLSNKNDKDSPIEIGTLINRPDVKIYMSGEGLASRHLAILAQTGGGKTVASRRIITGLAQYGHPTVIFDPHGDYLGLSQNLEELKKISGNKNLKVKLLTPKLLATRAKVPDAISELVSKLGLSMTEAQRGVLYNIVNNEEFVNKLSPTETNLLAHIEKLQHFISKMEVSAMETKSLGPINRKLRIIVTKLENMEKTNQKLRSIFMKKGLIFEDLPDPETNPKKIVNQNQISILYLGGYERVVQSTMVSIILEHLFDNRSSMTDNRINAFSAIIEEAHNFVPSKSEEKGDSPSLMTIRRLLTEGRKFGTGVILISQRPGRLDETTLAQCNTFLVLKLVNPRDQNWVRNVMEQMSEQDAKWLKAFGKGQGFVSGYAVKIPLQVQIKWDSELETKDLGRERFIEENLERWNAGGKEESDEIEKNNKEHKDLLKKTTRIKL